MHKNPARQLGDGVVNAAFPQPFHRFLATGILALVLFPPIVTAHICLLRHFSGLHKGQRRRAGAPSDGSAEADWKRQNRSPGNVSVFSNIPGNQDPPYQKIQLGRVTARMPKLVPGMSRGDTNGSPQVGGRVINALARLTPLLPGLSAVVTHLFLRTTPPLAYHQPASRCPPPGASSLPSSSTHLPQHETTTPAIAD
jgi:hypothetical protein